MSTLKKTVLITGDYDYCDFRAAVSWLAEHTDLAPEPTLEQCSRRLEDSVPPELVVIAQSRPGQFSRSQIEQLHGKSPLTRLVALLGSWCEGEPRSGNPWPGVVRVYWHQWKTRVVPGFLRELDFDGKCAWQLPRTASAGEQFAHVLRRRWPQRQGLVAISARCAHTFHGLRDVCSVAGFSTVWLTPANTPQVSGISAALWDSISCEPGEAAHLTELAAGLQPAPVIAVLDFVRRQDHENALAAGASAVIAKPFLMNDLLLTLDRIHGHQRVSEPVSPAA
jgi:CheY-like chemotaxis protein